jgi:hypothetical protein
MVNPIKVMKVVKEAFSPNTFGDEYPVNIDLDRAHLVPGQPDPKTKKIPLITVKDEHLLLDADFLRCGKQDFPYPELFKGNVRTNLLFRFGNSRGQFVGLDPAFFKNWEAHPTIEIRHRYDDINDESLVNTYGNWYSYLDIRGFDWRESLECAVAVSCDELLTKNYKPTTGSDPMVWQRIPFGMKMKAAIKFRDLSTEGPGITASLHYLGYADTHAKQFIKVSGADFEKAELKLAEILSKFASGDEDERARALHILGVSQAELLKTPKRHVYCAYHSFSYQAPTGKKVESLRPFGKGHLIGSKEKFNYGLSGIKPGPKNFYFFFSDLQSRGTSGVEKHPWNPEGRDTFLRTPWLFLRINPPPSYLENVPWVEIDSKDQTDANGKTLEDRAAENDRIDMGVAKYAETPAMRWTRLTKEEKTAFIKKWMEDEKMTTE